MKDSPRERLYDIGIEKGRITEISEKIVGKG
jgi:hypothetical protein